MIAAPNQRTVFQGVERAVGLGVVFQPQKHAERMSSLTPKHRVSGTGEPAGDDVMKQCLLLGFAPSLEPICYQSCLLSTSL